MRGQRGWTAMWYGAVLAAALGWGYVTPAETSEAVDVSQASRADGPPQRLELRRVTQRMVQP